MSDGHDRVSKPSSCSQPKIDANRANARKSTGAKTAMGKAWSKGNALTHGLTSSQVVIERLDGERTRERYQALYEDLCEQFDPQDVIAKFRVKRVADNLWRLQRNDRAEAAMLEQERLRAVEDDLLRRSGFDRVLNQDMPGVVTSASSSQSIRVYTDRLVQLQHEIQQDGAVSPDSLKEFMSFFSHDPSATELAVDWVTANSTDLDPNDAFRESLQRSVVERAAALISNKLEGLRALHEELEKCEEAQRQVRLGTCCLAPGQLETLLRSRAAINKELEQDLLHLGYKPQKQKDRGRPRQQEFAAAATDNATSS